MLKHNINREAFWYRKTKGFPSQIITEDVKKMANEVQCALKRSLSIWTLIPKQSPLAYSFTLLVTGTT